MIHYAMSFDCRLRVLVLFLILDRDSHCQIQVEWARQARLLAFGCVKHEPTRKFMVLSHTQMSD
jgi:hypothetical protein